MSWMFLSHELDENTPGYGGGEAFVALEKKQISEGSSSRKQVWKFNNHVGTHVDFPAHFDPNGKDLSEYGPGEFIFERVAFVSAPVGPDHLIMPTDLKMSGDMKLTELLLIKTGFENKRTTKDYVMNGPGLHPDTCRWVRDSMPELRAIGFDFISLTAFQHREAGREAHRVLLTKQGTRDGIWIIEDMKLGALKSAPSQVLVAPLLVKGADGSQVSVFAKM